MPTSRKRRRPKRRQQGVRRSPYETLIRGVHTDERMGEWFRRACWSFHRAPFPVYPELDAQNNAMARALEWFMFDVVLPDSDRSPAEEWIAGESERQGWGAPVLERYLRFTRGKYGLYEVVTAPLPMLVLRQVGTERVVHARALDNPVPFEDGDIIAARLFPLEDAAAQRTDPEIFDLSPCSDVVPELEESVLLAAVEQGALGVETLYGAAPDWVANGIAAGEIGPLADAFFDAVSDGSLQRVDLQQ